MARIAVCTLVRNKPDLLEKSFSLLKRYAGIPYDHFVLDNGSKLQTRELLQNMHKNGKIHWLHTSPRNLGISIGLNLMIDEVMSHKHEISDDEHGYDYDYMLWYGPDVIPRSRRFLKKMVSFCDDCVEADDPCVVSPKMLKLRRPPIAYGEGMHKNQPFELVNIAGQCSLHPIAFWHGFRHDPYLPMASGQDEQLAERVNHLKWGWVRLPNVRCEHGYGVMKQQEMYPEEFGAMKMLRIHLSYGLEGM